MNNGAGAELGGGHMYPQPQPQPMMMMMAEPHGHGRAAANQEQQQQQRNNWAANDANTLLVVATLITTLAYQLGSNIPGGYWQDTQLPEDGKVPHKAGDPVMRDLHRERYYYAAAYLL